MNLFWGLLSAACMALMGVCFIVGFDLGVYIFGPAGALTAIAQFVENWINVKSEIRR